MGGWCWADVTKGQSLYMLSAQVLVHSQSFSSFISLCYLIQTCDIYDDIQYIFKDKREFEMCKKVKKN